MPQVIAKANRIQQMEEENIYREIELLRARLESLDGIAGPAGPAGPGGSQGPQGPQGPPGKPVQQQFAGMVSRHDTFPWDGQGGFYLNQTLNRVMPVEFPSQFQPINLYLRTLGDEGETTIKWAIYDDVGSLIAFNELTIVPAFAVDGHVKVALDMPPMAAGTHYVYFSINGGFALIEKHELLSSHEYPHPRFGTLGNIFTNPPSIISLDLIVARPQQDFPVFTMTSWI